MHNADEYRQRAHEMARGRDHRFTEGQPVVITERDGARGAWVPLEVWIAESELVVIDEEGEVRP